MQLKGKNLLKFVPDFTVIDMETTGRSNTPEDITEMSAIRYRNYKPVDRFSVLVKAANPVLPFVVGLTGIDDEMLVNAPRIEEVIEDFAQFIGEDTVLGHNVTFDLGLVNSALKAIDDFPLSNDFIDTLRISRLMNQDSLNHKLQTLCEYFGVEREVGHRAEHDCSQTAAIYIEMKNKYMSLVGGLKI